MNSRFLYKKSDVENVLIKGFTYGLLKLKDKSVLDIDDLSTILHYTILKFVQKCETDEMLNLTQEFKNTFSEVQNHYNKNCFLKPKCDSYKKYISAPFQFIDLIALNIGKYIPSTNLTFKSINKFERILKDTINCYHEQNMKNYVTIREMKNHMMLYFMSKINV